MSFTVTSAQRVVIKLGTRVLTGPTGLLEPQRVADTCRSVAEMRAQGRQVAIVSSGAVGLGMGRLGLSRKPQHLAGVQACAAVGQSILTETWQNALAPFGLNAAQVLLTREDVTSRRRHLAVRDMLEELLREGIVPVMNENDALSVAELKFGDNDVLSALVASLIKADLLVILSTAPGLIDMGGTNDVIRVVERLDESHRRVAGGAGSATSTGGMVTKLQAADIATRSGCATFITSGLQASPLTKLFQEGPSSLVGTLFMPGTHELSARQRHLAFFEATSGTVTVDDGAARALREDGASLLAKGCTAATGDFAENDVVRVLDTEGHEIARGRCQFSATDLQKALGKRRHEIAAHFPTRSRLEVIHRDDLVVL